MNATRYPRIRVSGDAITRSRQYGELARAQIRVTREGYERAFAAKGVAWDEATAFALGFVPAIRAHFPQLLTELEGIAQGAGLPFADVLAMNCRTEILWRQAVSKAGAVAPWLRGECSSFALEPDRVEWGQAVVAQNWDWLDVLADGVIVLETERQDGPNFVSVVEAGLLAKTTLNQAGVAIGINTIVCSLDGGSHGVPFHVLVRAVADARHISDAVEMLASVPRASSGNYILATADGAVLNIETAPGDARTLHPLTAVGGAVAHTNHFVRTPAGGYDLAPASMADSFVRLGRLTRTVVTPQGTLSLSDMQAALADHADAPSSICCHPDTRSDRAAQWATLASVVLDPAGRTIHLAEGTPCNTPWHTLDYAELLAPDASAPSDAPAPSHELAQ
ncbi:C45 family autoproteolytic acyltransferase/hydrolase [Leucobacter sp. HY1910]